MISLSPRKPLLSLLAKGAVLLEATVRSVVATPSRRNSSKALAAHGLLQSPMAPSFSRFRSSARRSLAGFALIEASVGIALVTLMLGGVFSMNAHILGLVKQGKEGTLATEMIQERIEQFRTGTWTQFTDPTYLQFAVGGRTTTATNLPGVSETIRVEPLTNPSNLYISYTRNPSGGVSPATPSTTVLTAENSVKMTIDVQWTTRGKIRKRSMVTVLTRDGLISL